jgi:hypothetical protein
MGANFVPYDAIEIRPVNQPTQHVEQPRREVGVLPVSERMEIAGLIVNKQPWQL